VDVSSLREFIVSPTVGSNAGAISELMTKLGSKNVHLLDNLHAKIYISGSEVIVGSCNLSKNGLGDEGLIEVATSTTHKQVVEGLNKLFDCYIRKADETYPTAESKIERLKTLQIQNDKTVSHGFGEPRESSPRVEAYNGVHTINFLWYGEVGLRLNTRIMDNAISLRDPANSLGNPMGYFEDAQSLAEDDNIKENTWILSWKCNADGAARRNGPINWMFITHIIEKGIRGNKGYTKFAGQAKNAVVPAHPFDLDRTTKSRIMELLNHEEFAALRRSKVEKSLWMTNNTQSAAENLIRRLRRGD
jgi:hypothetical protein